MAVDLSEFVDAARRQVRSPGGTEFQSTEEVWVGYLLDGFWEARLDGLFGGFIADEDGIITPTSGDEDLPREQVQLIVIYAGFLALRGEILNARTASKYKAGPVEFEEERSATVLKAILDNLTKRRDEVLKEVSGAVADYVIDAYAARTDALVHGCVAFIL